MRRLVTTALGLAAVAAVVLPAAASPAERSPAGPGGIAVNSATFNDPQGGVPPGGMDITTVTISNDDAGKITWQIRIPSHPTLTADKEIQVGIDVDRNAGTGSSAGNEFAIFVEGRENAVGFYRYDPAQRLYLFVANSGVTFRYSANVLTIEINRSAFGGPGIFDFELYAGPEDFPTVDDFAPDQGKWAFEVKIGATTPPPPPTGNRVRITSFKREPRVPTAGESFTVSLTVARVGRAGRFNGTVYCSTLPRVQRRWFGSVGAGRASCRWDIPKNAVGKIARGSISVGEGDGPIVTRRFSTKVVSPEVRLTRGALSYSPNQPRSGSVFYAAVDIRVRTGSASRGIRSGKVSCRATVGGRSQTVVAQKIRAGEDVLCGWRISSGTSGRPLNGLITVQSEGATLRVPFTRTVR